MGRDILTLPAPDADERLAYGDDANQFVDFRWSRLPGVRPMVVHFHGGFWRSRFDLQHAGNFCAALTQAGFHTANVEYRRVGQPGGGWPGTLEDALSAARFACARAEAPVVVTGHSAGGHLALWLSAEMPELAGVAVMGPVACLRLGWERNLGDGAVRDFLGGGPEEAPERYAAADPAVRESHVPRVLIHGTRDEVVPVEISRAYCEARGGCLVELEGADHFDVVDPRSAWWNEVVARSTERLL
ncbi:MAG TPA: alpha/beta hydrolase [Candidatus Sulfopaludibacter sp.]|jgi:acetyl esterase/lipase|nr:alpha/beta hydrolase [Candidatus Sulfopaludibacter sp.]